MTTTNLWWEKRADHWRLMPSMITVRPNSWYWEVFIHDAPLKNRYTTDEGAKLDALEFAKAKSRAIFGTRKVKLIK